ncbi:MAG: retropepsin-like aspartic protease family protein [Chromatiales bacterium]
MRRANFMIVSTLLAAACSLAAAAEFDTVCPLQEKAAATYYVTVDFNGRAPEEFMVDTGSSYVVISESTLAVLKDAAQAVYLKQVAGVLADGSKKHARVYRISSMRVGGCVINDVEAVALPGATRQILGLSALKKVAPFAVSVTPLD